MRILRNVVIGVIAFIAIITAIGFLLPSAIHVERSALISATPDMVYRMLSSPKIFNEWSPWSKMDTTMAIEYFGPPAGVGAGYRWNSVDGNLGTGTWTIIGAEHLKQVNITLQMEDMEPALSKQIIEPQDSGVKLTWTFDSDMGMNPFARWMGLLMEGFVGNDFEQGLASFNELARKKSTGRIDKIERITEPPAYALTVRTTTTPAKLGEFLARSYAGIVKAVESRIVGAPFAIYHSWSKDSTDVEAGMPIAEPAISSVPYTATVLPGGPVIRASYYGPYEGSEMAHTAVFEYLQKNGLKIAGSPWEVYVTDPGAEPDPSLWLTYICYPVSITTTP